MSTITCHVVSDTHLSLSISRQCAPAEQDRLQVYYNGCPLTIFREVTSHERIEQAVCLLGVQSRVLIVLEGNETIASSEYQVIGNRLVFHYGDLPVDVVHGQQASYVERPRCTEYYALEHCHKPILVGWHASTPLFWYRSGEPTHFLVGKREQMQILCSYRLTDFPGEWEHEQFTSLLRAFLAVYPVRAVPLSRSQTISDGWLSPTGNFYPCNGQEHNTCAWYLGIQYYQERLSEYELDSLGWIRVFSDGFFVVYDHHPRFTCLQYRALRFLADGLEGEQRHVWMRDWKKRRDRDSKRARRTEARDSRFRHW